MAEVLLWADIVVWHHPTVAEQIIISDSFDTVTLSHCHTVNTDNPPTYDITTKASTILVMIGHQAVGVYE